MGDSHTLESVAGRQGPSGDMGLQEGGEVGEVHDLDQMSLLIPLARGFREDEEGLWPGLWLLGGLGLGGGWEKSVLQAQKPRLTAALSTQ